MKVFKESELILNPDGSVYHLHLRPEHISNNIILVGDPDRVSKVSKHFDSIEFKTQKREFVSNTGYIGKTRLTVLSTGIGTDNIDIVLNELDALVNIDLNTKTEKEFKTSLNLIRIGTSGTLRPEIPCDTVLYSEYGLSLDGLMNFYELDNSSFEKKFLNAVNEKIPNLQISPRISKCSDKLMSYFEKVDIIKGVTASCTGFYGPQDRILRAQPVIRNFVDKLAEVDVNGHKITNLEMETAAIYGLSNILGHHCLSINTIIANRRTKKFSKEPKKAVEKAILNTLEILSSSLS
ncbi:MAG: uridine phosphorylase [Planctomycetota bacterium]|jgi:uridine phosphorylase